MNTDIESYKNFEDKRVVLLQSGGLDSNVCAAILSKLGFEIHHLFVDYGQNTNKKELSYVKQIVKKYGGILHSVSLEADWLLSTDLSRGNVQDWEAEGNFNTIEAGTYVPHRNAILLNLAGSLAEQLKIPYICSALDGDETFDGEPLVGTTDKHPTFVKKIEDALCEGSAFYHLDNKRFTILTPIMGCSKEDTIRLGQEYNADFSLSWSCYNSEEKPCLHCSACKARAQGFFYAGIEDPLLKKFGLKIPTNKIFDLSY